MFKIGKIVRDAPQTKRSLPKHRIILSNIRNLILGRFNTASAKMRKCIEPKKIILIKHREVSEIVFKVVIE